MVFLKSIVWSLIICALLTACGERDSLAPVVESHWRSAQMDASEHRVQPGETLYAIAFNYDQDYRQLAAINHIRSPYVLAVGQRIFLKSYAPVIRRSPNIRHMTRVIPKTYSIPHGPWISHGAWLWPARGTVIANFSPAQGKKGIDIAGRKGQTIYATANGTVAYAGDGLAGYGNLILIKHDHQLLSAYGYNERNLVHVGQKVRAGQAIAAMGRSSRQHYAVHFEVRKAGRPVNPKGYLR